MQKKIFRRLPLCITQCVYYTLLCITHCVLHHGLNWEMKNTVGSPLPHLAGCVNMLNVCHSHYQTTLPNKLLQSNHLLVAQNQLRIIAIVSIPFGDQALKWKQILTRPTADQKLSLLLLRVIALWSWMGGGRRPNWRFYCPRTWFGVKRFAKTGSHIAMHCKPP